jgi:hypothetical protein
MGSDSLPKNEVCNGFLKLKARMFLAFFPQEITPRICTLGYEQVWN